MSLIPEKTKTNTYYLTKLQSFTNALSLNLESLPDPKPTPSMNCEVFWRELVVMDAASSYTYDDWDQQLLSILVFQSKIA